ncbi:MAG TPA: ribonucleoside triphosphate reductase [Atribacteraceae bacterium]|nr:ribonucleoside triphosphate reductase [Atribacteraceae bacterium]
MKNYSEIMAPRQVRKRDGRSVPFDRLRIERAIYKAFQAVGETSETVPDELSRLATIRLFERFGADTFFEPGQEVDIETIQDTVEEVLIENGFSKVAKAYILYRRKRQETREALKAAVDVEKIVQDYLMQADWRTQENSNTTYSYPGLVLHTAGSVMAHYTLNRIYPDEVRDAHVNADLHIHDLSYGITAYCAGWSIEELIREGFGGVKDKVAAGPAKHLSALTGQMVNFLGTMQMEFAGAQAFNSVDTYLAPFIRFDRLNYRMVKQLIQQMVFAMNVPSRWGSQAPFINFSFDWIVPEDLRNRPVIIGGQERPDLGTYGDYQGEMDMINRSFIEVMLEGDFAGRVFSFPIPTYNITRDFPWESENALLLWRLTSKYGVPYFQNFISSTIRPGDVRSMCCRLQLDLRTLRNRGGGLFGSADKTGSIGVVTVNLPRIAYLSKSEEAFFSRLARMMTIAKTALEIKRKVVERNMKNGLLPYTKRYLGTFRNHFSTIGLVGMNEACENFLGVSIADKEGKAFAMRVLAFMRHHLTNFQEETGNLYNLEATPAEGASYRLAKHDRNRYPDIITSGGEAPFYTNSSCLPVNYTDDPFEALEHQNELQTLYTGGTVFHAFLPETPHPISASLFIRRAFERYSIPYLTITPTFSICPNHGYLPGKIKACPDCETETEVYSRVVGYYRPINRWNRGKQAEFQARKEYVLQATTENTTRSVR